MNLHVTTSKFGGSPTNPRVYVEDAEAGKKLATIYGPVATRTGLAHMFAAAPEMRSSIEDLLAIVDALFSPSGAHGEVIERARTALMKANGAQNINPKDQPK